MRLEPKNKYEFCEAFSRITKRPVGLFLKGTQHWPESWFFDVMSLCKEKDPVTQAKIINAFVRDARAV